MIGTHTLSLIETNLCRNKHTSNKIILRIKDNKPPVSTYNIDNITVYRGQKEFLVELPSDLFYDDDSVRLITPGCIDDTQNYLASEYAFVFVDSLDIKLHKDYLGQ
mmetsp:Transcript_10005/g.11249  ORF Transcript_10005/g.11249 Transcript_10005/m.11249 type:complete len:106 (-) Transcript_10005:32-349(-)